MIRRFKPQDEVPSVALYWVHHYQHRTSHLVRVAIHYFPSCSVCGEQVRFEAAPYAVDDRHGWLRKDRDFQETANKIPVHEDFVS